MCSSFRQNLLSGTRCAIAVHFQRAFAAVPVVPVGAKLLRSLLVLERWALLVALHLLVLLVGVLVGVLVVAFSRAFSRSHLTYAGVALGQENLVEQLVCWVRPRGEATLGRAVEELPRAQDVELHHKLELELSRVLSYPDFVVAVLIELHLRLEVLNFSTGHSKGEKFVHADCTLRHVVD